MLWMGDGKVKVTKLKRGYHINLSDIEMEVLGSLVDEGELGQVCDTDMSGWSEAQKRAYNNRTKDGQFLRTDENRRSA